MRNKRVEIVSINSYDRQSDVQLFVKKHQVKYPVLLEGKTVAEMYGVSGYPTFFVIDKSGKVIYSHAEYDPSVAKEIEKAISSAL